MPSLTEQVDQLFSGWDKPGSPGCSLAIMKDGQILYTRGYGSANLEYDIPITPRTIFHVASVSKQFTDFAIALLAQEGKLCLDDPVQKFIPELPDFGHTITVRNLIHHTSGLRDQWELLLLAGWRMEDVITTEDVLELLSLQKELNFIPGTEYLYSNSGYTLLGLIVERVSGQSLRDFAQERIFKPLGMTNTHFHDDLNFVVKDRAYSYAPIKDGFRHAVLSYATVGATSLFTTVEDLACWDENFYTAAVGGQKVLEQMHQKGVLNNGEQIRYAFGLSIDQYRGLNIVEHSGGDAGFRSHIIRFPDQHFSVAILSNLSTFTPGILARRVADLYLEKIFEEKGEPLEVADEVYIKNLKVEDLQKRAGVYFNPVTVSSLRLTVKDGKLMVNWGSGVELVPFARDRFKLGVLPSIEVHFLDPISDICQRFELIMGNGKPELYEEIIPPVIPPDELEKFTGRYYSPELDVTYKIGYKDGNLELNRRKYGCSQLNPTIVDGFSNDESDLVFFRNAQRDVAGFRVSTGRIRNLLFTKTDQTS